MLRSTNTSNSIDTSPFSDALIFLKVSDLALNSGEPQYVRSSPKTSTPICHTPKFALMFLKTFHTSLLKDSSRLDQISSLLDNQPKLGFGISQIQMDF